MHLDSRRPDAGKKRIALARASPPRSPGAASTIQSTSSSGFDRAKREQRPATTDLDVVRVTADREDAAQRLSCRQVQHVRLPARPGRRSRPEWQAAPRRLSRLVHVLQALTVLHRVHRAEEAIVRVSDELSVRDELCEGLLDQLVAGLDQIHDLALEDEEASVDAEMGPAHVFHR